MPHVELPQAEFKVVLLGDSCTGKTSLVLRFAEGYYRDTPRSSTVGAFFITKRIQTSSGITCKIQIWDTAGQAQFRPMAPMYYRSAAAAIVCYDVTSAQSYKVMRDWLDELHRNVPAGSIVIAIAPTKCDLLLRVRPAVPVNEAEALAQALGAIFVETSAKDNYGVTTLFQKVAERVLRFRENGTELPVTPGASVNEKGLIHTMPPQELTENGSVSNTQMEANEQKVNKIQDHDEKNNPVIEDDYRLKNKESPPFNEVTDDLILNDNKTISTETQSSGTKLIMCDSSPLACGVFGDGGNNGEDRPQSCSIS